MKRLLNGGAPRWFPVALAVIGCVFVFGGTAVAITSDDSAILKPGAVPKEGDDSAEQRLL